MKRRRRWYVIGDNHWVWGDADGEPIVFGSAATALQTAIKAAKMNPGQAYFVCEAVDYVLCEPGEPTLRKAK